MTTTIEHLQSLDVAPFFDRDAWLAFRRTGIGASDVASALGESPYTGASPLDLWMEKRGAESDLDENNLPDHMAAGHYMESGIVQWWADRTGREVHKFPPEILAGLAKLHADETRRLLDLVVIDQERPWLRCTPDAWCLEAEGKDGPGVVQAKNHGFFIMDKWQEGEGFAVPPYTQLQVQTEMHVTGCKWAGVAAVIGGQTPVFLDVDYDPALMEGVLPLLDEFWERVQEGRMPTVDSTTATGAALSRLYPKVSEGKTVQVSEHMIQQWVDAKAAEKEAKERVQAIKNQVAALMGDAEIGLGPQAQKLVAWKDVKIFKTTKTFTGEFKRGSAPVIARNAAKLLRVF